MELGPEDWCRDLKLARVKARDGKTGKRVGHESAGCITFTKESVSVSVCSVQ